MIASLLLWVVAVCLMVVSVIALAVTLVQVTGGLIESYGVWVVGGVAVAGILVSGLTAAVAWSAIGVGPDYRRNGGADLEARARSGGATFLVPVQGFGPLRNPLITVGFDFSAAVRLAC